jgi:predicted amidohydrolase
MKLKTGIIQYSQEWENKSANQKKLTELLKGQPHVDLLIFPEMSLTGFTMQSDQFAEDLKGETYQYFSSLAKDQNAAVFYGVIEKDGNKNFNTLVHLNESGELITTYRKMHPYSYCGEDIHYGKGAERVITNVKGCKIGLSICFDLRFPEFYRHYAKERVHLIVDIANWPDPRIEHWRTLLKARSIETQCYVIGVNRVGDDPTLHYNGWSSAFDPMGKPLAEVENEEKVIMVDIDIDYVAEVRERLPFLKDIRLI